MTEEEREAFETPSLFYFFDRRHDFDRVCAELAESETLAENDRVRFTCPCCGYPTIGERGGYEICGICWWEDDGQDESDPDIIWGGPNHAYSLTQARHNVLSRLLMYRRNDPMFDQLGGSNEKRLSSVAALIGAFEAMRTADRRTRAMLWQIVDETRSKMRSELELRSQ